MKFIVADDMNLVMNIYKVERTDDWGYDECDAFICFAENEEVARYTSPVENFRYNKEINKWEHFDRHWVDGTLSKEKFWQPYGCSIWPVDFNTLTVTFIGTGEGESGTVILDSFNAG